MKKGKEGSYNLYIKRLLDIVCSFFAMIILSWLFLVLAVLVRIKLGSPVIYKAARPGKIDPKTGREKIFRLYKFRTMTEARDEKGELLPDSERLTRFGRILRATSLDELPELFNILRGDMSLVGPRPLATEYLPYYTEMEHHRHDVRPGLTGWAQVNGRNSISWEDKFAYDLEYVEKVSLSLDWKILLLTVGKVVRREGIGQGEEQPESLHILRQKQGD
ncbi:MAG: sugar transferase [Lachnospiraceae bacterium]|nr:sugar transferase [Lachnospiraceae bacterium]